MEFVFRVSADRKQWHDTSVHLDPASIHEWQARQGRDLTSTEHYAVAKLALFEAFDERPRPIDLKSAVRVAAIDLDRIVTSLDL